MINYTEFMRRYSSKIVGKFDSNDFDALKSHVNSIVLDIATFNGYTQIDKNKCTEAIMLYLLQKYSCDEILASGFEELIENAVVRFKERFYDKTIKKAQSKFKEVPLNNQNGIKTSTNENKKECINHIKDVLSQISDIFEKGTNIDFLANEIYDLLIYDGVLQEDILSEKCDFKIVDCIKNRGKYGSVKFSQEFNFLMSKVTQATSAIFRRNQDNLSTMPNQSHMKNEYQVYSNAAHIHEIAFRASVVLHSGGYTYNNIDYSKLNNFIQREISRIMIENSSVINQDKKAEIMTKANYKDAYEKELKDAEEKRKKKKRIIIGIIAAIIVLDNLGYKIIQSFKDDEPKKDSKPAHEYSINNQQENGYMSYDSDNNIMSITDYYNQRHK